MQITDLGNSLYGYVTTGGNFGGFIFGDNPNTAGLSELASTTSCMVLNSDFAQISGGTAQENLDGTTSHEYVHAIQNGWRDP